MYSWKPAMTKKWWWKLEEPTAKRRHFTFKEHPTETAKEQTVKQGRNETAQNVRFADFNADQKENFDQEQTRVQIIVNHGAAGLLQLKRK
jgi:hypothetical protein